jgi:biopolymer transport protein ExbB
LLLLASLLTWVVLLGKLWQLRQARRSLRDAWHVVSSSPRLADLGEEPRLDDTALVFVRQARDELRLSSGMGTPAGISERIASRLQRLELACFQELRQGSGVLATIGATAPFIGLFGTVWGIMNSFVGIAQSNTTDLAVVAPGIAEALLATALGLVAAIPAVIAHNHLNRLLLGLRGQLGDLSAALQQIVSRDLDRSLHSH